MSLNPEHPFELVLDCSAVGMTVCLDLTSFVSRVVLGIFQWSRNLSGATDAVTVEELMTTVDEPLLLLPLQPTTMQTIRTVNLPILALFVNGKIVLYSRYWLRLLVHCPRHLSIRGSGVLHSLPLHSIPHLLLRLILVFLWELIEDMGNIGHLSSRDH